MKHGSIVVGFLLLVLLMPVSTVFGGGASEPGGTQSSDSGSSGGKVTLSLLMSTTENRDGFIAVFKKIEQELNIATEIELRPGGAEGENILRSRLAVNEVSDINLFNSGSLLGTLNPPKNFYDLKDMPFMSTLSDAYKQTVTFDGGTYGIPSGSTLVGGWLYNKKVYAELGLKVPTTWAELMANSEKIKAAGKTAVIGSFGNDWTSQLVFLADYYNVQAQDPGFAAEFNANKAKFATTPAAFRAFQKMAEIHARGLMNPDYNATRLETALKMLVDGDGVQYPMLTNQLINIASAYGPDAVKDIGFFAQPGDDPQNVGCTVWMPNSFIFYKNSPRIQAALKWAEYYVRPQTAEYYLTVVKSQGPSVIKGVGLPSDTYPAVRDALAYFDAGHTAPALEFITSVKGPNLPQICIEVLGGLKTAAEGAAEYDQDVEKQAKQLGLPGW